MSKAVAIYKPEPIVDNPLFEGFGTGKAPSILGRNTILDDFDPYYQDTNGTAVPLLSPAWKPLKVLGRVSSFNDYPCIAMSIPAFSRRAVDGLRDMLEPNGELLPLVHPAGEYYAFYCTRLVDVLDRERCKAMWREEADPPVALWVDYFAVNQEQTEGLTIFRMQEISHRVFVTDKFVDRVHSLGLNGFEFVKVWPFPEGVDYKKEDAARRRAIRQMALTATGPQEVKAESLIIELDLQVAKISPTEKKTIARFQDELDAQLQIRSMDELYYGSLEGRRTRQGKTRLVLSCPDCNALAEKLAPWIGSLPWPVAPRVYLRHGSWDDNAIEEIAWKKQISISNKNTP